MSVQVGKHAHGVFFISGSTAQEASRVLLVSILAPYALQTIQIKHSVKLCYLKNCKEYVPVVRVYSEVKVLAFLDRNLCNEVTVRRRNGCRERNDIVLAR